MSMLKQSLKNGLPQPPVAPPPVDQATIDAAALSGATKSAKDLLKQKAWLTQVHQQNSTPPSPPAPTPPAPIPPLNKLVPPQPQINPLRLPTDVTAPSKKNLMNGINKVQDMKDAATAPQPTPVVAAALKAKITKKSGGSVQVSQPKTMADILSGSSTAPLRLPLNPDSYADVGAYTADP